REKCRCRLASARFDILSSPQPQLLLDGVDQSGTEFLASAVHRQFRLPVSSTHNKMTRAALLGFEGASLLRQPPFELLSVHRYTLLHISVEVHIYVDWVPCQPEVGYYPTSLRGSSDAECGKDQRHHHAGHAESTSRKRGIGRVRYHQRSHAR